MFQQPLIFINFLINKKRSLGRDLFLDISALTGNFVFIAVQLLIGIIKRF